MWRAYERVVGGGPALQSFECDRAEIWRAEKAPNPFRSNHQDHTRGNDRHNRRHCKDRKYYLHLIDSKQGIFFISMPMHYPGEVS
jgi:hypothetical protein